MSEIASDDLCVCGKTFGDHIGPRCPSGDTLFRDASRLAELAAAEERGRRRGVEERDELLREVRRWIADFPWSTSAGRDLPWMLDRIDAALAPRDSGKECGYLLSRDLGAEWRCGKPAGHAGPHSGERPS